MSEIGLTERELIEAIREFVRQHPKGQNIDVFSISLQRLPGQEPNWRIDTAKTTTGGVDAGQALADAYRELARKIRLVW